MKTIEDGLLLAGVGLFVLFFAILFGVMAVGPPIIWLPLIFVLILAITGSVLLIVGIYLIANGE